ncbi:biliverdin-producing heme oxygenase [Agrococcus baldri]|uniref:Heme oxygenase n=1 Tax=Agrococcus baldri TaxID=153730 RepID=A0AA87RD11_9MICO|nr:biliverdin-producing heme oxygenase [Agrococcus baldri]GEK80437.1 heme oxygenase [Agrococcus baldri]
MPQSSELAARLRAATWSAHQAAAGDAFLKGLLRGEGTVDDFARLASQHLVVYRALEAAVTASRSGLLARLHHPALERAAAIESDVAALGGTRPATAATDAYAEHLASLAGDPVRLAAHHYTRYLGDLSGGQHIGRALTRRFGAHTTSFYRFAIDDLDAFKQQYRATLDTAGLDHDAERALLEEAGRAYAASHAVHASLAVEAAAVVA